MCSSNFRTYFSRAQPNLEPSARKSLFCPGKHMGHHNFHPDFVE